MQITRVPNPSTPPSHTCPADHLTPQISPQHPSCLCTCCAPETMHTVPGCLGALLFEVSDRISRVLLPGLYRASEHIAEKEAFQQERSC